VFSTIFDSEAGMTETTEIFLRAFREKYGEESVPPGEIALAFDAYLIAVDAIGRANLPLGGPSVTKALARTREFPGASGSITFDDKGDPIKSVVMKTVNRGEIISTYTVEPNWVDIRDPEEIEEIEVPES